MPAFSPDIPNPLDNEALLRRAQASQAAESEAFRRYMAEKMQQHRTENADTARKLHQSQRRERISEALIAAASKKPESIDQLLEEIKPAAPATPTIDALIDALALAEAKNQRDSHAAPSTPLEIAAHRVLSDASARAGVALAEEITTTTTTDGSVGLDPEAIADLRRRVMAHVSDTLPDAILAMTGIKLWSNQQVTLFKTLLAKVLPDATPNEAKTTKEKKVAAQLTREELEAMASARATALPKPIN